MLLTFVADAEITLNGIKGAKRTSKFHPRLAPPLKVAPSLLCDPLPKKSGFSLLQKKIL